MEKQKYTEIENIVEGIHEELTPIFKAVGETAKATKETSKLSEKHPLNQLVLRLTKTARRHDLDGKSKVKGEECSIGTNHQGLGFQFGNTSQLSPFVTESRYNSDDNEQALRDILFNEDLVIDITSIIKKSNQKIFLKIVKILKEHRLTKAFTQYKSEDINKINVELNENRLLAEVDIQNGLTIIKIVDYSEGITEEVCSVSVRNNDDGEPSLTIHEEEQNLLKPISNFKMKNLSIEDIKASFFIAQHQEVITKAIKSKVAHLEGIVGAYREEHTKLNDLLEPIMALEKL